jgi:hypothetical protein
LAWEAVGLDVEPDLHYFEDWPNRPLAFLSTLVRRVADDRARQDATRAYRALVARARADGYVIHSYELPVFDDGRRVGASLLHRIFGVVDVGADVAIPMLYTSFMGVASMSLLWSYGAFGSRRAGLLWSYGRDKEAIFIGSTGGGVTVDGVDQVPPLDWNALARDLRLAARLTSTLGVFSLEGCVRQGFLDRLARFDWDETLDLPLGDAATIDRWRTLLRVALWLSRRPYLLAAAPTALFLARLIERGWRGGAGDEVGLVSGHPQPDT